MIKQQASAELLELMNKAIARELQVSIQYIWQHVLWSGIKGFAVRDTLREFGIVEMKHAEQIAERLNYLGGRPTTKPEPIVVGDTLKEMLELNVKAEEEGIELYRRIIELTRTEGDETTNSLFRKILSEEEDHHDTFTTLLEDS